MLKNLSRNCLLFRFLLSCLCLSGVSVQAVAGPGQDLFRTDRHEADGLAVLALLPDSGISLGKTLILASSLAARDLFAESVDPSLVEEEIRRLAEKIRPALLDRSDPRRVVSVLNRFLFVEERFTYDCVAGNPDNYLLYRVIANRRGNCLGLTALYLILAERLSLPLHGVYVPSHCFVRYEEGGVRINIEMGEKGAERDDGRYRRDFGLTGERPYLRSLGGKEMIGVYLKSLGGAYSRKGMEDRALRLYREAAVLYPGLPDAYFNAGVSHHRTGSIDEAIAQYRRALGLDPDLAVARDNLAVALAKKGLFREALAEGRRAVSLMPRNPATRANLAATLCACGEVEDGIREYRKVLEIDPGNARALAGLAKAHYVRGEFREAIVYCDRAIECGWSPDPAMLGTLEKYREPSLSTLP